VEEELSRSKREAPANAKEILDYFLRNPQATDSLEGIARWRLLEERVHRNVEEINEALGWLVAEGYLLRELVRDSDTIFRLNVGKAAQAERLLAKSGGRE